MLEIHPLTTDKLKYMNRTRKLRRCRLYHTSSKIEITIVEIEDGFKITANKPISIIQTANDNVIVKTYEKI
jgi:hypothetical protein